MPVCRHRDEVALLTLRGRGDLVYRIAARQNRIGLQAIALESCRHALEIRAVPLNFLALTQVELMDVARSPAVSDVDEDDRRVAEARELAHVIENRLVERRVLEGNEYPLVHG